VTPRQHLPHLSVSQVRINHYIAPYHNVHSVNLLQFEYYRGADEVGVFEGGSERRLPDDGCTNADGRATGDVDECVLEQTAEHEDETRNHPDVDRLDVRHLHAHTHARTPSALYTARPARVTRKIYKRSVHNTRLA